MKPAVMAFAQEKGLGDDFVALCKHKDVINEVSKSCLKECKNGGLNGFEIPSALGLVVAADGSPAWSIENELLTNTMKLKRPIIAKTHAEDIKDCYKRSK